MVRAAAAVAAPGSTYYREPLLRKTVTLPTSYVDQLTVLGHGNLSDGIRFLLECAHTSAGVRLDPPTLDP